MFKSKMFNPTMRKIKKKKKSMPVLKFNLEMINSLL